MRRRGWIALLVLALLGGVAAAGAPAWQGFQDRRGQQQEYDTGHAAFLAADCTAAVPALRRAASGTAVQGLAAEAAVQQQQCVRHLTATGKAGAPPDRLLRLVDYLGTDPAPPAPLAENARARGAGLLQATPPAALAQNKVCASTGALVETGIAAADVAARQVPALLLACIRWASEDEQDPNAAMDWLERLRTQFPASAEAKGSTELGTRLWVQTGRYFHSQGTIDEWSAEPGVREGKDLVRLELYNDGREPITLRLSGPQAAEVTFLPCPTCRTFADDASSRCQRKGTFRSVLLEPGDYELVTGEQRTLLRYGRMTLRAHSVYRRCFYSLT